jgi:hypothetical protein
MAKQSRTDELFEMLRARGLRRRAARALSDAAGAGRSGAATSQKAAMNMVADLRKLADELEDRLTGGKTSARSDAAQKAARTRQRKATARSTAAKKAAATRKRASSSGTGTKRSTTKRSTGTRSTGTRGSGTRSTGTRSGGTRRRSSS